MTADKAQSGSITLITLITIGFLTTLALGLAEQVRTEVQTLAIMQQEINARYAAEAGINMAFAEITNEPQNFRQSWQEVLVEVSHCSVDISITKREQGYSIYSDGQSGSIHYKVTAAVENYPGVQAKVAIENNFANQ